MQFFLIVAKGTKQGFPIEINVDLFLIGAAKMCQLRKDKLGDKHCAIVTRDGKVFIQDMDSGQSTLVNGSAIPSGGEWPLHAGDRIGVGPLEFLIQYREDHLSGKNLEEWAMRCLDGQKEAEVEEEDLSAKHKTAAAAAASIINKLNTMKGLVKGRLRVGVESGITTVRFNDDKLVEESDIALIKKELYENLDRPNMRVLIDLKNVHKLSTAAVTMLTEINRWLRSRGSSFALCRIGAELESAMSMLKMDKVPIFADKKVAMAGRW